MPGPYRTTKKGHPPFHERMSFLLFESFFVYFLLEESKRKGSLRKGPKPLQRSKMKGKAPHHVIFNARCTRYTMYLNSPAIRLNSTQT